MPLTSSAANQRGATLMVVLVMVVVVGLAAGVAGSTWKTVMQQAREEELLFRGDQYRRAIERYYRIGHAGLAGMPPNRLEDLLRDPRSPAVIRHLRRLYLDPMTGDDWVPIRDPQGRIIGVRSSSGKKPFRHDNFPDGYEHFRGAARYSDWEFVARPVVPPAAPKQPPQEVDSEKLPAGSMEVGNQ